MMSRSRLGLAVLLAAASQIALGSTSDLAAQDYGQPDFFWRISPYLWFANVDGELKLDDLELPVGDTVLETSFAGNVHVGKGRWRGIAVVSWMTLANTTELQNEADEGTEVAYDFADTEIMLLASVQVGRFDTDHALSVRGGVRWVRQSIQIEGGPDPGTFTETWLEPMFGVEYFTTLGGRFWATVDGDAGGFGIGSRITWGMGAQLGFKVANPVDIAMSYRFHQLEYENEDTGYVWDDGSRQGWFFGVIVKG